MRSLTAGPLLLALIAAPAIALGGPPFQTDDPEPVDLGHYEFYVFSNVDSTPSEVDPAGPAFEFNWGALPNTQVHVVLSFGAIIPTDDPPTPPASSPPSAAPSGWLLQRDVGEKWTLGGEVWYHGAEGPATPLDHRTTMIDLGGYHYFRKPAFQLLFCLGHSVAGHSETYGYLGLYWTWGKKGSGSDSGNRSGGDSHASVGPSWSFAARPLALSHP